MSRTAAEPTPRVSGDQPEEGSRMLRPIPPDPASWDIGAIQQSSAVADSGCAASGSGGTITLSVGRDRYAACGAGSGGAMALISGSGGLGNIAIRAGSAATDGLTTP